MPTPPRKKKYDVLASFGRPDTTGTRGLLSLIDSLIRAFVAKGALGRPPDRVRLSRRERQVLALIGKNYRNSEIASELEITESTVKKHTTSLYKKLGVSSRDELYYWIREHRDWL